MFGFCASSSPREAAESTGSEPLRLPISYPIQRVQSRGSAFASTNTSDPGGSMYVGGHRLSYIPHLSSNNSLELLALTKEAICERDMLTACRRIVDLFKEIDTNWMHEQMAQILARALLMFGDAFPYTSRCPPTEELIHSLPPDESLMIAVIVHEKKRPEVLAISPAVEEAPLDGLESYPVTYFQSNPPMKECPKELHAEAVMLWDMVTTDIFHMPASSIMTSGPSGVKRKQGATYFARKLYHNVMVIVCFPRSNREATDSTVQQFLDRLSQIFVN